MERRRGSATILALFAALCLYCAPAVLALDGVPSEGGTFRYGHVHWKSKGNAVEFTVEAAFKRAISDVSDWKGSAPDGLAQVGDTIGYPGRQPPQFYFGDGQLEHTLSMKVVAISVADDWVMGSLTLVHEYPTPNNNGEPWNAEFTGCCRYSYLVNNKDSEWAITAQIDLTLANKSPIASVLPIVSVPYSPAKDTPPTVYVPAYDDADKSVRFRVGKPWHVGNAAVFRSAEKSFIAVPLSGLAAYGCTSTIQGQGNNFAGPGCLFRALRTDFGHRAMTAEGWVYMTRDTGGYVVTVGADDGRIQNAEYSGPPPDFSYCGNFQSPSPQICRAAALMIRVNMTHVIVGHESVNSDGTGRMLETAFQICSDVMLRNDYLCTRTTLTSVTKELYPDATKKWFHVAVVRVQHTVAGGSTTSRSSAQVTYKVLVNGRVLQGDTYPGGPSTQRTGQRACTPDGACPLCPLGCASGSWCDKGVCKVCDACPSGDEFRFGCADTSGGVCMLQPDRPCPGSAKSGTKPCFENGESNLVQGPVPLSGNSTSASVRDYAKGAALIFGAYKGFAKPDYEFFDGALDEWRFWNGARSDSDIAGSFKKVLSPDREQFNGNPSDPTRRITDANYLVSSVLMASWNFDQECSQSGTVGCALKNLNSIYPADQDPRVPYPPGKSIYTAYTYRTITGDTDSGGRMFYSLSDGMSINAITGELTINTRLAGDHQVVVLLSYNSVASVPVDFIVRVIAAGCDKSTADETKKDCKLCCSTCISKPPISFMLPEYTCPYDKEFDGTRSPAGVRNEYSPDLEIRGSTLPVDKAQTAGDAYYVGEQLQRPVLGVISDDNLNSKLYPYSIRMFAGFRLNLQLLAFDKQEKTVKNDQVTGAYYDDIYTRLGFTMGRMPETAKFTAVQGTNPAQVDMTWTPCASDIGVHTMCFESADSHQMPGDSVIAAASAPEFSTKSPDRPYAARTSSEQRCVRIKVEEEPAPHFIVSPPPLGVSDVTPVTPQLCTMGKQTELTVVVGSPNCQATLEVRAQVNTSLPEGALLRAATPISSSILSAPTPAVCRVTRFQLVWTPLPTQGGLNEIVCFEAYSVQRGGAGTCTDTPASARVHCVRLFVQRCRYALQKEEQLQEVAALFDVDWMRLWSLNSNVLHPDYVMYAGSNAPPLMVGHLYRTRSNDEPLEIAKRMGMTTTQLQNLNYGLQLSSRLAAGVMLCVVPNSCTGNTQTKYSLLDPSSLARSLGRTTTDVHPVQAALFRPPVVDSVESIEAKARLVEQLQQPSSPSAP